MTEVVLLLVRLEYEFSVTLTFPLTGGGGNHP